MTMTWKAQRTPRAGAWVRFGTGRFRLWLVSLDSDLGLMPLWRHEEPRG